jgi:hypothetical protein
MSTVCKVLTRLFPMASAPSAANNVCCNAQLGIAIAYPTCPVYQSGSIKVARYPAIEINSGNVSLECVYTQ